jgi:hypothetical protein
MSTAARHDYRTDRHRERTETTMDLVHALLGMFAVVVILGAATAGAALLVVTPLHGPSTAELKNRDTGGIRRLG